ncbi:MAG TPA: ferredoxin reductase family protein [Solirubrobacteraceae bacterium]|jgi:predicted ferric reductase|nr:ferredoxin reductase family protein [Solirubrobacteraceae bacterium]
MASQSAAFEGQAAGVRVRAERVPRGVIAGLLWAVFVGNVAVIVWMWLHGGGVTGVHGAADLWTSVGRITGLVGTYLALVQILLLARLAPLERLVGFDRLTVWHRRNGKLCIVLIVAHAVLITVGYAGSDQISVPSEFSRLLSSYPGMVTATIGTGMMVGIVISSLVIVSRRLPYEAWYSLHVTIYAAIALGYLHQIPTGNEFTANTSQADYWIGLYLVTLGLLLAFRVVRPGVRAARHSLRVTRVVRESPDVVSVYLSGRRLDRLGGRGGQFMLWRFLDGSRWWQSHPFSLSAVPDGRSLRLTVKDVGRFTGGLGELKPGTRVLAEGPFGRFTAGLAGDRPALLIAGGIGITPLRCIFEELPGGTELIHRVVREDEIVLADELDRIARRRGSRVHHVIGDHRDPAFADVLSADGLCRLVPDLGDREIFVCGPPQMMAAVRTSLRSAGVGRRHIHWERFSLAA